MLSTRLTSQEAIDQLDMIVKQIYYHPPGSIPKDFHRFLLSTCNQLKEFIQDMMPRERVPSYSIYLFWCSTFDRPIKGIGPKTEEAIRNALIWGFSINEIKSAIIGCSLSSWHVEKQIIWLSVILKSPEQIQKFMAIQELSSPNFE